MTILYTCSLCYYCIHIIDLASAKEQQLMATHTEESVLCSKSSEVSIVAKKGFLFHFERFTSYCSILSVFTFALLWLAYCTAVTHKGCAFHALFVASLLKSALHTSLFYYNFNSNFHFQLSLPYTVKFSWGANFHYFHNWSSSHEIFHPILSDHFACTRTSMLGAWLN